MKLSKYLSTPTYALVAIVTLSGAFFISKNSERPTLFITKQQSSLNINENIWTYVNLGQKRLLSSLYWISTILESDVEHYKARDLNSWMYIRFNTISLLEPKFYDNYMFGGTYLSIIKDDLQGADLIYQKGLGHYPDDYSLLLSSGFHYYFEEKNPEKAYPLLLKLKNNPQTPQFIISSLARIESERGNLNDSFSILTEYQKRFHPETLIWQKVQEQRYSLKAEMDLDCLNNKKEDCSKVDLEGNSYIVRNGKFEAIKEWKAYRLNWAKK